jgi:hypothetical protein
MKMKKWPLLLALILIVQLGYRVVLVPAEETGSVSLSSKTEEKDFSEIKKVLESYLECIAQGDLDCVMGYTSKEFSGIVQNKFRDYDWTKLYYENLFKNVVNRSFSNLNILEYNITDNKATMLASYNISAFNLEGARQVKTLRKLRYFFIKEGGAWKIVSLEGGQDSVNSDLAI